MFFNSDGAREIWIFHEQSGISTTLKCRVGQLDVSSLAPRPPMLFGPWPLLMGRRRSSPIDVYASAELDTLTLTGDTLRPFFD